MNKERLDLLENYIRSGMSPLLVQDMPSAFFSNIVIIKSNIDRSELNGHYENTDFIPPLWYKELVEKSKTKPVVLMIENINEIPLEEQTKFVELLKYRKISTFELPRNCLVIATCSDLSTNKINEEVYSLLAQI